MMDNIQHIFSSVRRIISLLVTVVFCYLCITGKVSAQEFIPIFSMIIGYYFGRSTALDVPDIPNKVVGTVRMVHEE